MIDVLGKLCQHNYLIFFTTKIIAVITTGLAMWSTYNCRFSIEDIKKSVTLAF